MDSLFYLSVSRIFLSVIFAIIVGQSYGLYGIDWNVGIDNSSEIVSTLSDDDIYKCISYTAVHIDISHWIDEDISNYKDCPTPGSYNLNRRDGHFKVQIGVRRSWIEDVSFNLCYF
jgi:hypothetical protein